MVGSVLQGAIYSNIFRTYYYSFSSAFRQLEKKKLEYMRLQQSLGFSCKDSLQTVLLPAAYGPQTEQQMPFLRRLGSYLLQYFQVNNQTRLRKRISQVYCLSSLTSPLAQRSPTVPAHLLSLLLTIAVARSTAPLLTEAKGVRSFSSFKHLMNFSLCRNSKPRQFQ